MQWTDGMPVVINNKNNYMKLNKPYNSIEYADFAVYCNENNLSIEDKGEYLEGIQREINLDELKYQKLQELKQANENYIYSVYPQYKQNNIAIFGTEEERKVFKDFKEATVGYYYSLIQLVNLAKTKKQLAGIKYIK